MPPFESLEVPSDPKKSQYIDRCMQVLQVCVNKHEYDSHIKFEVSLHFDPSGLLWGLSLIGCY